MLLNILLRYHKRIMKYENSKLHRIEIVEFLMHRKKMFSILMYGLITALLTLYPDYTDHCYNIMRTQ